jgi:hypothetical protein
MDDKAKAAYWRELADVNERHGRPSLAAVQRRSADRLDPPKPEYPVGTIAWTRSRHDTAAALRFLGDDGGWRISGTSMRFDSYEFESIEVIPTLPEGHVAIPDDLADDVTAQIVRNWARDLRAVGKVRIPRIIDAYAVAVEAKDNQ